MPDILIRGMEMPTDSPVYLTVCPSGGVYVHTYERGYGTLVKSQYQFIELPEHGDLIDRSELKTNMIDDTFGSAARYVNLVQILDSPVVIPSNKEETE